MGRGAQDPQASRSHSSPRGGTLAPRRTSREAMPRLSFGAEISGNVPNVEHCANALFNGLRARKPNPHPQGEGIFVVIPSLSRDLILCLSSLTLAEVRGFSTARSLP